MAEWQQNSITLKCRNGLMTPEQWNNYLYEFCLHILQQKKQE